jgi:hypothetical protein
VKRVSTTYACDLCEKVIGEDPPRRRIPLAHGACCDLCSECARAHLPLLDKLTAIIHAAAAAENPYHQMQGLSAMGRYGG